MFLRGSKNWRRHCRTLAIGFLVLLVSTFASAAGRIEWGNKKVKANSDNSAWKIEIKVFLPRAPDVPSVPTKFIFQQLMYYERAMVDGDKLNVRNVPIEGKLPVVESVDIGFLDPRVGKIESRTQFSFKIRRDRGFECGEYKVTVRDARNDSIIGQPTTIILDGENEVIDRRSIVFSGDKKKDTKKVDSTGGASDENEKKKDEKKKDDAEPKKSEEQPKVEAPPEPEPAAGAEPAEIKQKPGGCGCRVSGDATDSRAALGWFVLATALLLGRRVTRLDPS
jgi:MYXO-CTERM domain-containing protein